MGYKMVREPFMLLETVGMLYRYVNGISFQSILSRQRFLMGNDATEALYRRTNCLQAIMEKVCAELNPDDPNLRRFFGRIEVEGEGVCLAQLLTESFISAKKPGLEDNTQEICDLWGSLQNSDAWIRSDSNVVLVFSQEEGSPGNLFRQVLALSYPAEFRLALYDALQSFEETMSELKALILPLANRLEALYEENRWLWNEVWTFWRDTFREITPLEFLAGRCQEELFQFAGEETTVAFSMMNSNMVLYNTSDSLPTFSDSNCIFIGCCVTPASLPRCKRIDLDNVTGAVKALADRKRLEMLQRLARERSYGAELAEIMGTDQGNLSRALTTLYNYGFLCQERENQRTYYKADREAFHNFWSLLETVLFSE